MLRAKEILFVSYKRTLRRQLLLVIFNKDESLKPDEIKCPSINYIKRRYWVGYWRYVGVEDPNRYDQSTFSHLLFRCLLHFHHIHICAVLKQNYVSSPFLSLALINIRIRLTHTHTHTYTNEQIRIQMVYYLRSSSWRQILMIIFTVYVNDYLTTNVIFD